MIDQVMTQTDTAGGHDFQTSMNNLCNYWLEQGTKAALANDTTKVFVATVEGLASLEPGIAHAVKDDVTHIGRTLGSLAGSVALGAMIKAVLPETGVAGKIALAGISLYGLYGLTKAAAPMGQAYSNAIKAQTMDDLNTAGGQLANVFGGYVVNGAIYGMAGATGYGLMNKALLSERLDAFAVAKEEFWSRKASGATNPIGVRVEGGRAILESSEPEVPKGVKPHDVDPSSQMNVALYPRTKGSPFLIERHLARINAGKQATLTDVQIADKFGPHPDAVAAIEKFAKDSGLEVTEHDPVIGRLRLTGTTGQMMKTFGFKMQQYDCYGLTVPVRSGPVSVPAELAPHVRTVQGFGSKVGPWRDSPRVGTSWSQLSYLSPYDPGLSWTQQSMQGMLDAFKKVEKLSEPDAS